MGEHAKQRGETEPGGAVADSDAVQLAIDDPERGQQREQHRRIAPRFRAVGDEDRRYREEQRGDDGRAGAAPRADQSGDEDRGRSADDRQPPAQHWRGAPSDQLEPQRVEEMIIVVIDREEDAARGRGLAGEQRRPCLVEPIIAAR